MSDPVTNIEIEDVLSSIRRLVTDDGWPESRKAQQSQPVRSAQTTRLVLTPALRVTDTEPPVPMSEGDTHDTDASTADSAHFLDGDTIEFNHSDSDQTDVLDLSEPWQSPDATLHQAAALAEARRGETSEDAPPAEPEMADAESAVDVTDGSDDFDDDAEDFADDSADPAEDESDTSEGFADEAPQGLSDGSDDFADTSPAFDDDAEDFARDSTDPAENEPDTSEGFADEAPQGLSDGSDDFADTSPAFDDDAEDLADNAPDFSNADDWLSAAADDEPETVDDFWQPQYGIPESDGNGAETWQPDADLVPDEDAADPAPQAELPAETPEQPAAAEAIGAAPQQAMRLDTLRAKIKALEAAIAETPGEWEPDGSAPDANAGMDPVDTLPWQDHDADAAVSGAATSDDDDTDSEETLLDEATLRDMVAEIVRQELQGALGERITRNVRKLVRREIQRALTAQDIG